MLLVSLISDLCFLWFILRPIIVQMARLAVIVCLIVASYKLLIIEKSEQNCKLTIPNLRIGAYVTSQFEINTYLEVQLTIFPIQIFFVLLS